jgi:ribosomal protein L13E
VLAGHARAAGAAEKSAAGLHAVAHHLAAAVRTRRRNAVDRALEAVEDMTRAASDHPNAAEMPSA